jgi:hypothetical protein
MYPDMAMELARSRMRDDLARAEAHRLARQARQARKARRDRRVFEEAKHSWRFAALWRAAPRLGH